MLLSLIWLGPLFGFSCQGVYTHASCPQEVFGGLALSFVNLLPMCHALHIAVAPLDVLLVVAPLSYLYILMNPEHVSGTLNKNGNKSHMLGPLFISQMTG